MKFLLSLALLFGSLGKRLQALGVRAQGSTPQELGRLLSSEIQRWRGVIVAAKIPQQ